MNLNVLRKAQVQFPLVRGVIIYCEQKAPDRKVSMKKLLVIYLVVYADNAWTSTDSVLGRFAAK